MNTNKTETCAVWILLRYTHEGKTIKEVWTQSLVQGDDRLDRMHEDAMAEMLMPRISCELIKKQTKRPTIEANRSNKRNT
jgi:hypothetical protein